MKRLSNPKFSQTYDAIRKTTAQHIYDATRALIARGKDPSPEAICKTIGAPPRLASRLQRSFQKGPKFLEAYMLALSGKEWPENFDEIANRTPRECDLALERLRKQLGTTHATLEQLKKDSKMGWGILNKYDLAALERRARANNVETTAASDADEKSKEKMGMQTGTAQNAADLSEKDGSEEGENDDMNVKEAPAPESPVIYESKEESLATIDALGARVEKVRSNLRVISSQPWTKRLSSEINALTLKIAMFSDSAEDLKERCEEGQLPHAGISALQQEADIIEQELRNIIHPKARPEEL
ncbi:hypothetical protein HY417_03815 [Candidatus Kaiserbacteria bacterium]|nr:hypothetical protein [Candidatus Kaiserbacteria bacterium]